MWIKFFSDSTDQRSGFSASVANAEPVCGSQEVINVTSFTETSLLTSPDFPRNYPANVRCRWVLTSATRSDKIRIRFVDLSVEQSRRCGNDYLRIEDAGGRVLLHDAELSFKMIPFDPWSVLLCPIQCSCQSPMLVKTAPWSSTASMTTHTLIASEG